MGSSCSSAQRKAKKSGLPSDEQRRESVLSTDSIPYGKASPQESRKTSSEVRNNPPASHPAPAPPTPAQGNHAPPPKVSSSPETPGLPDLQQFPEKIASLLMGRFQDVQLAPSVREINIFICADFKETEEERSQLTEKVLPELKMHCTEKGYVLHWLDMHWGVELQDFREICLDTILREKSGRLLLLLLLDDCWGLGPVCPPLTIEEADFQKALDALEKKEEVDQKVLLEEWYDDGSSSSGRTLRKGCSSDVRQKLVCSLRNSWTEMDMKTKYLNSVLEDILNRSILRDARLAKRSLWLQPRTSRSPRQPGTDDEATARFSLLRTRLQEQLPDAQKVTWGQSGADPMQELCRLTTCELKRMVDVLVEEDFVEEARRPYKGIENPLFNDLLLHSKQARHYCQLFVGRDDLLNSLRTYLTTASDLRPLVLHSPPGHGKSSLLAKAAQMAAEWNPETPIVLRFVGATPDSMTPEQLLRSICEQLCALYGAHPSMAFKRVRDLEEPMASLLEKVSNDRPLVVMIDGLEQIVPYGRRDLSWLTADLPQHVKVILTVRDDTAEMKTLQELLPEKEVYVAVPPLTPDETVTVIEQVLKAEGAPLLSSDQRTNVHRQTTPLNATLIGRSLFEFDGDQSQLDLDSDDLIKRRVSTLAATFGLVKIVLSLLASARYGLADGEILDLLKQFESVDDPRLVWTMCKRRLNDFLRTLVVGGIRLVTFSNSTFRTLCAGDQEEQDRARRTLRDYFQTEGFANLWPNRRKMEELPYCQHLIGEHPLTECLLEPDWLREKLAACDPYTLLEELDMAECDKDPQLRLLFEVIQRSAYALRYDGSQWLTQFYVRMSSVITSDGRTEEMSALQRLYELSRRPPSSSLLPMSPQPDSPSSGGPLFTALYTMRERMGHMLSLTPSGGEIVVWDVFRQAAARTLSGVVEPKDVRMIDDRRALVLCGRELKVYDLESGRLLSKLKGVMNQQMAYFGLHNENYVVALSRNRMYVNMMSLNTGDLETTFKVGEDRFLNSLLVSSNGRICVCGDETQKPFPLLVWDLANRKLLYDLRIPHHEFLTRMSAISHDGHYVVCVCREIDDGSPNFIIVYDLQSGTLFKKWKPESNSCSIAISAHGGCVINGLENTLVLVWDLSTGARRFNLQGHTAPVDQIKLDDQGINCLTYDSSGRDRSLRMWDVAKGECLAVFTPDSPVRCAQLTLDGLAVVAGFEGRPGISTLLICQNKTLEEMTQPTTNFGDQANEGKVFDVSQQG